MLNIPKNNKPAYFLKQIYAVPQFSKAFIWPPSILVTDPCFMKKIIPIEGAGIHVYAPSCRLLSTNHSFVLQQIN